MPTQNPATFASAAASTGSNDTGALNGRSMAGPGEWSRPRTNGATATFRRSSQVNSSAHGRESSLQGSMPASNVYVPPHANAASQGLSRPNTTELKYSREQLLEFSKGIQYGKSNSDVLTEGWSPGAATATGNGGWARRDDAKDGPTGADICWDQAASIRPLGLTDMNDEEKELFSTSVNSPLKPPPQTLTKEAPQSLGINGRKSSLSQMQSPGNPMQSGRPGTRRRETSDTVPGSNPLASPTAFGRTGRDDGPISTPPPSLIRRRTDLKDLTGSGEKSKLDTAFDVVSPFNSFKRAAAGPASAGLQGPSSPWGSGPQSSSHGAFGNFAIEGSSGTPATPGEKKFGGLGSMRGESRFKGLMGKESSEDIGAKAKERPGLSLLERLGETDHDARVSQWSHALAGKDTSLGGEHRIGSAALGGDDSSPPHRSFSGLDQRRAQEEIGFSGLTRDPRIHDAPQGSYTGHFEGSMSPTGTNPFQSSEGDLAADAPNDIDEEGHPMPYGLRSDRSQTSSTNPGRGLAGLQSFGNLGLGGSGGWSGGSGAIGSAGRATSAFSPGAYQESIFSPMVDVSSPVGMFGGPGNAFGAIGRGPGKMSSLFSAPLQDQMRSDHGFADPGQNRGPGIGGFGMPIRDTDSPSRNQRGPLDDFLNTLDPRSRGVPGVSSPFTSEALQRPDSTPHTSAQQPQSTAAPVRPPGNSPPTASAQDSNQMPTAQKKQMVMPDRMRWIYRDPSGNTQGPWSGLEMHDWYKAGFFSPELLVRKLEDQDYEPLAQLIRRIGNSREPFLVPQIGIAHDTSQTGSSSLGLAPASTQAGGAQPPFPSAFPSFGTTLTAQQQNDLERRKQEEQFLMARQKEQLAAHQAMMKSMQMSGMPHGVHPQALNHHSSAQSLHSQPSFGSITSPSAYQPSPGQLPMAHGGIHGFFDRPGQALAGYLGDGLPPRDPELSSSLDRLNLGRATQSPYGAMAPQSQELNHQQQVTSMLNDRARIQREQEEQEEADMRVHTDDQGSNDRLDQFQQLRSQGVIASSPQGAIGHPIGHEQSGLRSMTSMDELASDLLDEPSPARPSKISIPAAESAHPAVAPPAPSISPLPAPAAQRNRQHVAENLTADSRSQSQTPSVETPSAALAPWAKEAIETAKGPSLKEIQEAEAKKAAQQEEVAATARRQLAEQERISAANAQAQIVAGLPSGANWAANASPTTTASSSASAWAKKPTVATPTATAKKTLAQIQKEEEARKNRAAAAAAAAAVAVNSSASLASTANIAGGKRYADLAGKVTQPSPVTGGAWTTVGASGKAKAPVSPAVAPPQRSVSGSLASPAPVKSKAATPMRSATGGTSAQTAQEEFQKWAKAALGKGLNSNINVDNFVYNLLQLPAEPEMLSDAVYANSQTLDGRRFAEEFVRRRKLADKGVAPEVTAASNFSSGGSGSSESRSTGGWSEVAKKGPAQQEKNSEVGAFKVVAAKKKGKR